MTTPTEQTEAIRPPSRTLFLSEGARALAEIASYAYLRGPLGAAARGDGHPVLVIPGFTASDVSTQSLRGFLERQGWEAYGWELGRNLGPRPELERQMVERLARIHAIHRSKVSIVGQSLGGIFARELARWVPDLVRMVITLGSPFAGIPGISSNIQALYDEVTGGPPEELNPEFLATLDVAPPVPTTAIYSKGDGIVSWRACVQLEGDQAENIEVPGSHVGMGFNALVLYAIADRLALEEDDWRPFERHGWRRAVYPEPVPCLGTTVEAPAAGDSEGVAEDVARLAEDLGHLAEEAVESGVELTEQAIRELTEDLVRLAGDFGPQTRTAVGSGVDRASASVGELGLLDFLTFEALTEALAAQRQGRFELRSQLISRSRQSALSGLDHLRRLSETSSLSEGLRLQRSYLREQISDRLEDLRDLAELARETAQRTFEPFTSRMGPFGRILGRDWSAGRRGSA